MFAVTQHSLTLVQSDLRFRPINVIAKTVGDVGKLVVRQANHSSMGNREFRIVSGDEQVRAAPLPEGWRLLRALPGKDKLRRRNPFWEWQSIRDV
jgi:hypothetical protein